jgi:hypothetical protein
MNSGGVGGHSFRHVDHGHSEADYREFFCDGRNWYRSIQAALKAYLRTVGANKP